MAEGSIHSAVLMTLFESLVDSLRQRQVGANHIPSNRLLRIMFKLLGNKKWQGLTWFLKAMLE